MFIKVKYNADEDNKKYPSLVNVLEIKYVLFVGSNTDGSVQAEIYFRTPLLMDKKGDMKEDWLAVIIRDKEKFMELLKKYNLLYEI